MNPMGMRQGARKERGSRYAATSLFLLGLVFVYQADAATVNEIRLWRAPDHTRLVFDLSASVSYNLFTLENPERIVIDIEDSTMGSAISNLDFAESPIQSIRNARRDDDSLRIVLDLSAKTRPSSFILTPNSELGDRLVVDLYDEAVSVPTTASAVDTSPPRTPRREEKRDIVVAIAAGHGGEDPGGTGYDGRLKEKDITLSLSQELFRRFQQLPGYTPIMIRDGDYYVQLKRRPEIAREHRADIFLSVHTDWYKNSNARGVTLYALSGDRADRENSQRVADKENSSDLLGGVGGDLDLEGWDDDVAMTLVSLQMAWSMEQSVIAGAHIIDSLRGVARLRKDKVQQASLQVLNSPDIPSLLIETGYLTNPEEARKLASSSYQRQLSAAIAAGVQEYFFETPPEGSLIAWQKENGVAPATYTVRRGDSLSVIAQRFAMQTEQLKAINGISGDTIGIGQVLKLAGDSVATLPAEHKISSGETLSGIAQRYRVSLSNLKEVNNIRGDIIRIGQILKIPTS